ncbi:sulfurtransferase [Thermosynechococcus sp. TG215]|nr:sulfurtransferase [Thermosynechococcus sp. TG215]
MADPTVVIVDCRFDLMDITRGQREYAQGHIPRAYYLDLEQDLSSPRQQHGGRHPLPDPEKLAARLNQMGITPDTLVVAYDDSRFAYAARCWWLLRWLGHDRAAVLDGGYRAYVEAGYPTTPEVPSPRPGNFQPHPHSQWVVDRTGVMAAQADPQTVIVDAREPRRYRGEIEPIDPIAGHIPGAVNYPWQAISDAQGRLKSVAELQAHWQPLAEAEQIIVYCGSGVTACVDILGLAIAGLHQTKLYAGSWSDWCSYLAAPHDRSL